MGPGYHRLSSGEEGAVGFVVAVLRRGGVAAFPTETFYGLAADPFQAQAMEQLLDAKGRSPGNPLPLIAPSYDFVVSLFPPLPGTARLLAERFWPGPLTLALPAPEGLHPAAVSRMGAGVRVPGSPLARSLAKEFGGLLTATSANVSGFPPAVDPDEVEAALSGGIDCLLDGGRTSGGLPSTVIGLLEDQPVLIRRGAVSLEEIENVIGSSVLEARSL